MELMGELNFTNACLGKTIVACNNELCGGKHYKGIKNAYI